MKSTLTIVFIFSVLFCVAQNHTPSAAGAKGLALGNTNTTTQDAQSLFGNQAGLAFLEETSFTAFGENRFFIAELNQFSAGVAIPVKNGTFGLAVQYFGFEDYNEQKIGIAYGRKLFDKVAIGIQIDYLNLRVPFYGNQGNITAEIGLQLPINDKFLIGVHVFSPFTIAWSEEDFVPTILATGITYQPSEKLSITAEVEKDIDFPVDFKFGIDYKIVEMLSLRVGANTYPVQNSFGLGLNLKNLNIDVAMVYHQILGLTTGFSATFRL